MRLFDNHKPSRSSSHNSTKMGATTQPKYSYPLPPPPPPRRQIMTCSQKNEFFTGVRARFGGLVFAEHNSQSYPNVLAQDGEHLIYFVLTLFPAAHFKPKVDPRDADHNRRFIRKFFFSIFSCHSCSYSCSSFKPKGCHWNSLQIIWREKDQIARLGKL